MAGRGPAPSGSRSRKRDEAKVVSWVDDGKVRGFPLPKVTPDGEKWHPWTVRLWKAIRKSPQAAQMLSELDWLTMLDNAYMHHIMCSRGRWEYASELRLRMAKFGVTPEDRARLKAQIVLPSKDPDAGSAGNVTALADRRRRLSSASTADQASEG